MGESSSLRGAVIMFDGPDYVGKSTQLALVSETLKADGLNVYTTRYNGGTPIGEALRKVMLGDYERPPETDLYINLAQQHALTQQINTERQQGKVILVDRSPMSIIAYQIYGSHIDENRGFAGTDEVMRLHRPDLLICYQAPESVLAKRRQLDKHKADYFESKSRQYFEDVAEGYGVAAKRYSAKILDASGSISEVHETTMKALEDLATALS